MQQLSRVNQPAGRPVAARRTGRGAADRDRCAAAVLELGLVVSRFVRAGMWQLRPAGLTVNQFRALTFLNAYPEGSPSELAEYLMLSRPAVSRLVDELVTRRLLSRRPAADDRRRVGLSLTATGRKHLDDYFAAARQLVAERLAPLSPGERAGVTDAVELVRAHFDAPRRLGAPRGGRKRGQS